MQSATVRQVLSIISFLPLPNRSRDLFLPADLACQRFSTPPQLLRTKPSDGVTFIICSAVAAQKKYRECFWKQGRLPMLGHVPHAQSPPLYFQASKCTHYQDQQLQNGVLVSRVVSATLADTWVRSVNACDTDVRKEHTLLFR